MLGRNILLLIVLINVYSIRGELIRGVDIPQIDIARALGKWYVIMSPTPDRSIKCLSLFVYQPTKDVAEVTGSLTLTPERFRPGQESSKEPYIPPMNCTMVGKYNMFNCSDITGQEVALVVLDIDYDSYMAVYVTDTVDDIKSSSGGIVILFGREQQLPYTIIEKTKKSIFFKQSMRPDLYSVHEPIPKCT